MGVSIPTIESIEEYLEFLKKAAKEGIGNVPKLDKRTKNEYRDALNKIEYWQFVQSADYHYFISRILFLHHILEYSQFSGYQCIENYLKAYLKHKGNIPPAIHDLRELHRRCLDVNQSAIDDFIHNDNITIIISKYEPFYELARYPVQRQLPKAGYAFIIPNDIYILDYFVMKMREILVIPKNTWDILMDGHHDLFRCKSLFPDFYNSFIEDNINFIQRK